VGPAGPSTTRPAPHGPSLPGPSPASLESPPTRGAESRASHRPLKASRSPLPRGPVHSANLSSAGALFKRLRGVRPGTSPAVDRQYGTFPGMAEG
jgi:hypothetical protein